MFSAISANADETAYPDEDPRDYALRVSELKARLAAEQVLGEPIILSADTVVADRSEILGKPETAEIAERMLKQLRGRTHQVYTALTLLDTLTGQMEQEIAVTDVPMRSYSDEEIAAYIASGDPFDKAGAYAIQHPTFKPARTRTGCYANVIGLPLCHFLKILRRMDIPVAQDVPYLCQSAHEYECGVFVGILRSAETDNAKR